jgi:hypothetical protein
MHRIVLALLCLVSSVLTVVSEIIFFYNVMEVLYFTLCGMSVSGSADRIIFCLSMVLCGLAAYEATEHGFDICSSITTESED